MRRRHSRWILGAFGLVLLAGVLGFAGCSITTFVTYDGNGNDGGFPPTGYDTGVNYVQTGTSVTVLGNTGGYTKTGFTWSGWNTQANGSGTTYMPGQTIVVEIGTTLYAIWK